MAEISSRTGLSRVQLYRSFSPAGNPRLKTILAVMSALGVELSARPPARRSPRPQRQIKRAA
jgi:probable addiction module antidote protein